MSAEAPLQYARVVVDVRPSHLDRPFDYLVPDGVEVGVGSRVRVRFAGRLRDGWVVEVGQEAESDPGKVRPLEGVLGAVRWFDEGDLAWLRWTADRFAAPLADVLRHAFAGRVAGVEAAAEGWPAAAPPQRAERPPCPSAAWRDYDAAGLLRAAGGGAAAGAGAAYWLRVAPRHDEAALVGDLVARCLAAGRRALVVVPDPASPVAPAVLALAGEGGADLRLDDEAGAERRRHTAAVRCRTGHAHVAVGERAAALMPLDDLGLVVVVDEANPSYKERRSPRHHAREVALARARMLGATCVLTGDLPSASLWRLLEAGHVARAVPHAAAVREGGPLVEVVDRDDPRPGARRTRFSDATSRHIARTVEAGGAVAVLAARGGQGTALACSSCRARRECPVCDSPVGAAGSGWRCATCGWAGEPYACHLCGAEATSPLAAGAGRLAQELARSHPDADVVRMEGYDAPGPARRPGIAVMTRGSVVTRPSWLAPDERALTVLVDADALLGRPVLDAAEDALRLWFAAGRWSQRLVVQTREPTHPAIQALVRADPDWFWKREAARRAELRWPPAAHLVRLTAPADMAAGVTVAVRQALPAADDVLGPDLGGATLVKCADLRGTLGALAPLRQHWDREAAKVRVDVDPLEPG